MGLLSTLCIGDRAPAARRRCHSFTPSLYPSTEALESRLVLSLVAAQVAPTAATRDTLATNSFQNSGQVMAEPLVVQNGVLHAAGAVAHGLPFTAQQSTSQQIIVGSVFDTLTLTRDDQTPPTVNVVVDGSGRATGIGKFTSHATYALPASELQELLYGPYNLEHLAFTLDTGSGQIFGFYDVETAPLVPGTGTFSYRAQESFSGGTGRWDGITGGYCELGVVTIDLANLNSGQVVGQVSSVIVGSYSLPATD